MSPHFDDAVFSLGAFISRLARAGHAVRIVTVFGGDLGRNDGPSHWDQRCGFTSGAEAIRRRRAEDAVACRLVGATAVWLPFSERAVPPDRDERAIRFAVAEATTSCSTILLPGFPLFHPDHVFVTQLLLQDCVARSRTGLYVEQPYAAWKWARSPRELDGTQPRVVPAVAEVLPANFDALWTVTRSLPVDWIRKTRAALAYRSQFRALGRLAVPRLLAYEVRSLGERIAWLSAS